MKMWLRMKTFSLKPGVGPRDRKLAGFHESVVKTLNGNPNFSKGNQAEEDPTRIFIEVERQGLGLYPALAYPRWGALKGGKSKTNLVRKRLEELWLSDFDG